MVLRSVGLLLVFSTLGCNRKDEPAGSYASDSSVLFFTRESPGRYSIKIQPTDDVVFATKSGHTLTGPFVKNGPPVAYEFSDDWVTLGVRTAAETIEFRRIAESESTGRLARIATDREDFAKAAHRAAVKEAATELETLFAAEERYFERRHRFSDSPGDVGFVPHGCPLARRDGGEASSFVTAPASQWTASGCRFVYRIETSTAGPATFTGLALGIDDSVKGAQLRINRDVGLSSHLKGSTLR